MFNKLVKSPMVIQECTKQCGPYWFYVGGWVDAKAVYRFYSVLLSS